MTHEPSPVQAKRVLVTGATGLVGGFVVEELLARGAHVIALVRDQVRGSYFESSGLERRCDVVHGDLENAGLILRIFNEYQIHGVIHLGAQTQVRVANEHPVPTWRANIEGTWNVLEAARQVSRNLRFVIVASSDKAYGEPQTAQYTEDHPLRARYPYDVSKACADMLATSYAATYKVPAVITRCGNFFGPGDLNWDRLVPHVIASFLAGEKPVIRSSGQLVRDYFFVRDGALAYVFLAEKILEMGERLYGEAFNFSYGQQHSVLQFVALIAKLMDAENLTPKILDQAPGEISHQSLSPKKARDMLAWRPRYSLDAALTETIAWYRARSTR